MTTPTLEDLRRELRSQAAQARRWPLPAAAALRARRTAARRRRALAATAACAAVAAVAAVALLVPGLGGRPDAVWPPAGRPSPTLPATPAWHPVTCARPDVGGCAVPQVLLYGGRRFASVRGGRQPLEAPNGLNRRLQMSLRGSAAGDVFLVGALHRGPGSHLLVRDGHGVVARLGTADRLLLLDPPRTTGDLVVLERGRPHPDEILVIEEYAALPAGR